MIGMLLSTSKYKKDVNHCKVKCIMEKYGIHYMAFAKTPKRLKLAVLAVPFKLGFKIQVL